jgi:hypothetical protein
MKMCMPHWRELKTEVEAKGLSHLIAKDGKTTADNMVAEAPGRA